MANIGTAFTLEQLTVCGQRKQSNKLSKDQNDNALINYSILQEPYSTPLLQSAL